MLTREIDETSSMVFSVTMIVLIVDGIDFWTCATLRSFKYCNESNYSKFAATFAELIIAGSDFSKT